MNRIGVLIGCVLIVAGCGATAPRRVDMPSASSEPAMAAVLPFQNATGDPSLNWLRSALSATLSTRLREQRGMTTVDGAMIRQTLAEQHVSPSATLDAKTAISLSGVLYAQTLITGSFERAGKQLTIAVTSTSGETGQPIRSVRMTGRNNEQSALIDSLIAELLSPEPLSSTIAESVPPVTPSARDVVQTDRPARVPAPVALTTPEEIEAAIRLYRRALEANPDLADAHFALGYAYEKQGDYDKALAAYRQAVTLSPLNADYLYAVGYVYERKKEWNTAVESYRRAFAIKPDDPDIAFAIGYVCEQMGKYPDAIDAYKRAIELKPDDVDAHYGLAIAAEASGRVSEAMSAYRQVVQLKPDSTNALSALAALSVKAGQWDDAIAAYETIVKTQPDDLTAYQTLANAYRKRGRLDQAIAAYREIIRLQPQSAAAYTTLGNLYVQKGVYDQAVEQYQAGLRVSPNSPTLHYNLGNIYAAQKKYRAALAEYTLYLKVAPNGEYAKGIRDLLSDLQFKATSQESE